MYNQGTFLYNRGWYNTVNQLYFNGKLEKIEFLLYYPQVKFVTLCSSCQAWVSTWYLPHKNNCKVFFLCLALKNFTTLELLPKKKKNCYQKSVLGPTAPGSKAHKQARLVERKVCFISDAGDWGLGSRVVDVCPNTDSPLLATRSKNFYRQKWWWEGCLHAETAQRSLTVIFKLVIGGLTSVILFVLGPVNLQLQGPLAPISLWPVLGIGAARVPGPVWSSCG